MPVMNKLSARAKANPQRIVFPEGEDERVIKAATRLAQDELIKPILVGNQEMITNQAQSLAVDLSTLEILDPNTFEDHSYFASCLFELRQKKGMTLEKAHAAVKEPLWFATLMVRLGLADGLVGGAVHTTADMVRAAIQGIGLAPDCRLVSSCFIIIPHNKLAPELHPMVFSDCALVIAPNNEEMAEIALSAADTARRLLDVEPRVGMLSFSTNNSAHHDHVDRVASATQMVKARDPELLIDGELQLDAALVPEIAQRKLKHSMTNSRANVLVFPSLEAGNIGYKIAERIGGARAIGPILQGLAKPANDLSRGCSTDDIYNTAIVTAVQALEQ